MSEPSMSHAELEGRAVAYALLIMKGWDVAEMNREILAAYGPKHLVRIKRRAWQHVRANRAQAPTTPPAPPERTP